VSSVGQVSARSFEAPLATRLEALESEILPELERRLDGSDDHLTTAVYMAARREAHDIRDALGRFELRWGGLAARAD
jgi:hypothetical protein